MTWTEVEKTWLVLKYILREGIARFADRLEMRCERKRRVGGDGVFFGQRKLRGGRWRIKQMLWSGRGRKCQEFCSCYVREVHPDIQGWI